MNRLLLLFVFILFVCPSYGQKKKRTPSSKVKTTKVAATKQKDKAAAAVPEVSPVQQALDVYDFEKAEQLLTKEIETLKKKKQSTEHAEFLLHTAQTGRVKLHATERIVIIDSLVCPKEQALKAILLSKESGRIDTYASTYHTTDVSGATIYENELANKRYLAVKNANKSLCVAVSDKLGDEWSKPEPLKGLDNSDITQNYPFLLSDGITLYYAATGPESLGGFDIFVTRADGEDGEFLSPENIGFPFNSSDNDYLMAIDEMNQLGWFISDRRQPKGKVCVYTFIYNDTRKVYGDETCEASLRALARINSIRDTWKMADKGELEAAKQRLVDLRAGKSVSKAEKHDFNFVIDDNRTYIRLTDFQSPEARTKMQRWMELDKNNQTDAVMLGRLRENYINAKDEQRKQLAQTIQKLEATHYSQLRECEALAKEIRNLEITFKK